MQPFEKKRPLLFLPGSFPQDGEPVGAFHIIECGILCRGRPRATGQRNERHEDKTPFDSQGKNTSDLDVTLVGSKVMELWNSDGYYIPGQHTKPLCDKEPGIAPSLNDLRVSLQELVGRPVNFQATSSLVLYSRDILFGEPYYVVVHPEADA